MLTAHREVHDVAATPTLESRLVAARRREQRAENRFFIFMCATSWSGGVVFWSWVIARMLGGRGPLGTIDAFFTSAFMPDPDAFAVATAMPNGAPNAATWVAMGVMAIAGIGARVSYLVWEDAGFTLADLERRAEARKREQSARQSGAGERKRTLLAKLGLRRWGA